MCEMQSSPLNAKGDNRWSFSLLLLFPDASSEQPKAVKKKKTLLVIEMAEIKYKEIHIYAQK